MIYKISFYIILLLHTLIHASSSSHREDVEDLFRKADSTTELRRLSSKTKHTSPAEREYWLLSLDGGGERGILHLKTLAELEKRTGERIVDMFDGIAGTSIGGIIAILLTTPDPSDPTKPRYTPQQLLDIFFVKRFQMFQPKWFSFAGFLRTKYKSRGMKDFLFEMVGGNTLKNRWLPTVLVTHDLDTFGIRTFSSIDKDDYFAKDVAMATAAAPTYYKPQQITPLNSSDSSGYFVSDGGTCMSSPTLAGVAMLEKIHHIKAEKIHVLSLGTGLSRPIPNDKLKRGGILNWLSVITDLLMYGQQHADINVASLHLGKRYHRFNPRLEPYLITFDSLSDSNGEAILNANQQMLEERREEFDEIATKLKTSAQTKEIREVTDSSLDLVSSNNALQNFISWLSCWYRMNLNQFFLSKKFFWPSIKSIFAMH